MRLNALPKTKNPHLSIVQFLKSLQIKYLPDLRRCVSSEGAHYTDQKLSVKHLTTFFASASSRTNNPCHRKQTLTRFLVRVSSNGEPGGDLLSHTRCALSSAQLRFTVLFEMGRGGSEALLPPSITCSQSPWRLRKIGRR